MGYTENIRMFFLAVTLLVIGTISLIKIGAMDLHAIWATAIVLVPAMIVMGYLGQKIGEIVDNPKNRADADYKLAVSCCIKCIKENG